VFTVLFSIAPVRAGDKDYPSAQEVRDLLRREPISLWNWTSWQQRLLARLDDPTDDTHAAYIAAWAFMRSQASGKGELPPALSHNAFAWYLLARAYTEDAVQRHPPDAQTLSRSEACYRRSINLDPRFSQAHANLANVLVMKAYETSRRMPAQRAAVSAYVEAKRELAEARRLQPASPLVDLYEGKIALLERRYADAERLLLNALSRLPKEMLTARAAAIAITSWAQPAETKIAKMDSLLAQFPDDGRLLAYRAFALAENDDFRRAAEDVKRARQAGVDPKEIVPPKLLERIDEHAKEPLLDRSGWITLICAVGTLVIAIVVVGPVCASARRRRDAQS
jgi:hypothetical protein